MEKKQDALTIVKQYLEKLADAGVSLYIEYNDHKILRQTVAKYIQDESIEDDDFVSNEDKQKCIKENVLWKITYYPDTPIGCHEVYGSEIDICIDELLKNNL